MQGFRYDDFGLKTKSGKSMPAWCIIRIRTKPFNCFDM
jgi:hypothetical protein